MARSSEALVVRGRRGTLGCVRDDGRRFRLDEPGDQEGDGLDVFDPIRLSGKFALYEYRIGPLTSGDVFFGLQAGDLRTGEKIATVNFDTPNYATTVYSSVLKRNGSFAWIQDRNERGSGDFPQDLRRTLQVCQVRTCARGTDEPARPRAVAEGFDIKARSLFRRGSRIYWTEGGERRSATL